MGKKVLILGNGFDLAHGLPTHYYDFLNFTDNFRKLYTFEGTISEFYKYNLDKWKNSDDGELSDSIRFLKETIVRLFNTRKCQKEMLSDGSKNFVVDLGKTYNDYYENIKNNIWFYYLNELYTKSVVRGLYWIDFETEITIIIKSLEKVFDTRDGEYRNFLAIPDHEPTEITTRKKEFNSIISKKMEIIEHRIIGYREITISDIKKRLQDDLDKLILCLEVYLNEIAMKYPIDCYINDIYDIKPDYVISFNYTPTYEKIYKDKNGNPLGKICHVHGSLRDDDIKINDMVLGANDVSEESENYKAPFDSFEKCCQRSVKQTDKTYIKWCDDLFKNHRSFLKNRDIDVYVMGHSLDVTDKQILAKFFAPEISCIHLFCRNMSSRSELHEKLIGLIGRSNVISKDENEMIKYHSYNKSLMS